jgi:hypothetical protein
LTPEQRALGLGECSLPDPGLVYLAPPRSVPGGSFFIPASGGMAADGGYDVIVHFHGGNAVKKTVARQARGVAYVGIDLGNGSGAYADAFPSARPFDDLRSSLENALRAHANDPRAHVRHLALSGWSAGYGAINSILRAGSGPAVDAVILLDGFHANLTPAGAVDPSNITPLVAYARGASLGEGYFYFSHSRIATEYASTSQVAAYLLAQLGVRPVAATPTIDPLGLLTYADREGFHLRAFDGADARAHCDHTRHIAEALAMLEERWHTPEAAHPDIQDRLPASPRGHKKTRARRVRAGSLEKSGLAGASASLTSCRGA